MIRSTRFEIRDPEADSWKWSMKDVVRRVWMVTGAAVLATMREGVLIVNSKMHGVLYNDAAARIVKPGRGAGEP